MVPMEEEEMETMQQEGMAACEKGDEPVTFILAVPTDKASAWLIGCLEDEGQRWDDARKSKIIVEGQRRG